MKKGQMPFSFSMIASTTIPSKAICGAVREVWSVGVVG